MNTKILKSLVSDNKDLNIDRIAKNKGDVWQLLPAVHFYFWHNLGDIFKTLVFFCSFFKTLVSP